MPLMWRLDGVSMLAHSSREQTGGRSSHSECSKSGATTSNQVAEVVPRKALRCLAALIPTGEGIQGGGDEAGFEKP